MVNTVKVKPSHSSQGDFVVIETNQFDPTTHVLADGEILPAELSITLDSPNVDAERLAEAEAKLADVHGEFIAFMNDVQAMQARISELEVPSITPNEQTIPEIKELLKERNIPFKVNASKDELLALVPKE